MDNKETIEQFEYAKTQIKQKKMLFFHFVVFVLGSILMYCFNEWVQDPIVSGKWWPFTVSFWALIVFLHAVNVLIVNRFMGKRWQDKQIAKLIQQQQKKIDELRAKVEKDYPLVDVQRDLNQK
ncbi:MAG: 2TM domain-containing protein [Flavobacteriaceae bacterium]|jgi:hypothetical protein|nr:2TM domain-containing protein [Flavobacteriaceae bacterium]